jgi:hypothetical protein
MTPDGEARLGVMSPGQTSLKNLQSNRSDFACPNVQMPATFLVSPAVLVEAGLGRKTTGEFYCQSSVWGGRRAKAQGQLLLPMELSRRAVNE